MDEELPDLAPYIRRHHVVDASIEHWLAKFVVAGTSRPTGQLLMTWNDAIAQGFSYKRRSSRGTRTPGETTSGGDFALLMIEAARALGFAARLRAPDVRDRVRLDLR